MAQSSERTTQVPSLPGSLDFAAVETCVDSRRSLPKAEDQFSAERFSSRMLREGRRPSEEYRRPSAERGGKSSASQVPFRSQPIAASIASFWETGVADMGLDAPPALLVTPALPLTPRELPQGVPSVGQAPPEAGPSLPSVSGPGAVRRGPRYAGRRPPRLLAQGELTRRLYSGLSHLHRRRDGRAWRIAATVAAWMAAACWIAALAGSWTRP